MIIKLSLTQERVKYVIDQMGNDVKVGEVEADGMIELEFDINRSYDLLRLFHAGIECGFNHYKS